MADNDILSDAMEAFQLAEEAEQDNRDRWLEDIRFARLGEQWPEDIARQRRQEGRPMLTINRLPTFIRQVVNDARQNKPAIKVQPVDSFGDPETAEIYAGIVRHIESRSGADIAYDTGIDSAVSGGFGYWRIGLDYAHDDTFDLELSIDPVADPLTVYGDPMATSADGSDWNSAFVVEKMPMAMFERRFKGAAKADFEGESAGSQNLGWFEENAVRVAEWWTREEVDREVVQLADGSAIAVDVIEANEALAFQLLVQGLLTPEARVRTVKGYAVKQCLVSGAEVLDQRDWPGRWIPIVPVYGDEVNVEGKRHFLSLIHAAKDPQRQLNFWRTAATELVALAPKVPFIGPESAFAGIDAEKWQTANTTSWPTLSYPDDAKAPPQRQQMDQTAYGAIQEAANAQDDLKSVIGIHDASLGARGNETSGRAIIARQREGDTSTFHFIDNLSRAVRQSGRILIDLIPHVWSEPKVVRLLGEDGMLKEQPVNQPVPVVGKNGKPEMEPDPGRIGGIDPRTGRPLPAMRPRMRIYDLTVGRYDVVVSAGPSYTTRREEAAGQMIELLRAVPQSAPLIGDLIARNLDWPGADEIAERLKTMLPQQVNGGLPPQVRQAIDAGMKRIQELEAENEKLKAGEAEAMAKLALDARELAVKEYDAETKRLHELGTMTAVPPGHWARPLSIYHPPQPQR